MGALKKAITPVVSIISAIVSILPSLFKKKRFVLWYLAPDGKWVKKSNPMSNRQCEKTMDALWELGPYNKPYPYFLSKFKILREGVTP